MTLSARLPGDPGPLALEIFGEHINYAIVSIFPL